MNECERCNSEKIKEEIKNLPEDLSNFVKIYSCETCGFQKISEIINIQ